MKKALTITAILLVTILIACEKVKTTPQQEGAKPEAPLKNYGPCGKFSKWKSVGGDTLFTDTLTLSFFYEEKTSSCNICYYQQNYSLWNDYDYTFSVSACAVVNDTLTFIDIDTNKKAVFKREK